MPEERKKPTKRTSKRSSPSADNQSHKDADKKASAQRPSVIATPFEAHRKKRTRLPYVVIGIAILVVAAIVVAFALTKAQSQPSSTEQDSQADNDVEEVATESQSTSLTLSFAGDCTLGTDENFDYDKSFNNKYESAKDPAWFFENVADIFSADDLSVVNMEGTLTTSTSRADKTYAFKGDAEYAQVLVDGNIEAASLANNHSQDYGEKSYTDTIEALENADIKTFGYDRIAYFDLNGVKVALIGTYELAEGMGIEDEMLSNIQSAQEEHAQIIVVYAHWGIEGEYVPEETQIEIAHDAIDAGATLVVGSHPHVLQGYEKYHGRYIIYSLGNFCFGGNSNPSDKDCLIFQQTFTVTGSSVAADDNINVIPCTVSSSSDSNNYQPTPAEGSAKERIEEKVEDSNASIDELSAMLQD